MKVILYDHSHNEVYVFIIKTYLEPKTMRLFLQKPIETNRQEKFGNRNNTSALLTLLMLLLADRRIAVKANIGRHHVNICLTQTYLGQEIDKCNSSSKKHLPTAA